MADPTRTLQFFGQAYGETPVTLVASIGSTELFNGTVSTVPGTPPMGLSSAEQVLLFTVPFASGPDGRGSFLMTVSVSGGDSAILGTIKSNYAPTGIGTNTGPDVYGGVYDGDARSFVKIDGVDQPAPVHQDGLNGTYCWLVHSGSTLSCNLNLS